MILVADGGSTKCDWILLAADGKEILRTHTRGLNPTVFKTAVLQKRIEENTALTKIKATVTQVDFYGAGCGTITPKKKLEKIFSIFFENAKIHVEEDMLAAVLSVTTKPGIVCILGTGSNSCYFDGEKVHQPIPSLGYVLMDEASGNYFGKKLITDFYYGKMPKEIANEFQASFPLDADEIKQNLYNKENPNAYLAHFAEFILRKEKVNPYFYDLIYQGIKLFVENRVLTFNEAKQLPVHFVGSVAYFSKDIIASVLNKYELSLGNIIRKPIDGLIAYYKNHRINT